MDQNAGGANIGFPGTWATKSVAGSRESWSAIT